MAQLVEREALGTPARTSASRRMRRFMLLVVLADAAVLIATARLGAEGRELLDRREILAVTLAPSASQFSFLNDLTPWLFALWGVSLLAAGAYESRVLGGGVEEFRRVALATAIAVGGISTVAFFFNSPISRGYLLVCFAIGLPLLIVVRYGLRKLLHRLRSRGRLRSRVLAVCSPDALVEVDASLRRVPWSGYKLVGACVPARHEVGDAGLPVPILGGPGDIVESCEQVGADIVLVAGGGHESSQALREIGWELEGHDISLVVVPSLVEVAGPRIHMRQVGGLPLVHVDQPKSGRANGLPKRAFDLLVAGSMLAVLALPMLVIAAAIKLHDRGPVFYHQLRNGRGSETFGMLKFRSMVVDADRRVDDLLALNDVDEILFKMRDDPRITPMGRLLRRFSLDEVPQLVNVLRGEMSIVGPRPPLPREVADYPIDMHRRLLVRPGLTGLWQVSGRSDLPFEEAVRMDLYYVDNWSIVGDVIIMLKTVRAVVTGSGAY